MSLYVLSDLHLAYGADKPMDVFGGKWNGYMEKLSQSLAVLQPDDTIVLPGDFCWALDLEQAKRDFAFIAQYPGRKLFVKGNHDYWWTTVSKFTKFCCENDFQEMYLLHNTCYFYRDLALCGTRGWFFEEDQQGTHDEKVFRRELLRLEASLQAAGDKEKYCFLHYPPLYRGYLCPEILELLAKYKVSKCYYGHLHGDSHKLAIEGEYQGVKYALVSADRVDFKPVLLME